MLLRPKRSGWLRLIASFIKRGVRRLRRQTGVMRGALFHHRRDLGKIAGIWRQQSVETRVNGQKFASLSPGEGTQVLL